MKQTLIFGGYTKRISQGIHEAIFNLDTGKLEDFRLIYSLTNPTYLCTNQDHSLLFSLIQTEDQAGVIVLGKDDNNQWHEIDTCLASKINGCHISYYDTYSNIYVSNYHEGTIDVYHFDGQSLTHIQKVKFTSDDKKHKQEQSRIHFTKISPNEKYLYACNLGLDYIEIFDISSQGILVNRRSVPTLEGMGPRHFVYHPSLPLLYVNGEYSNSISVYKINEDGGLTEIDSIKTLPEELLKDASGAAIKISSDGKFLYTSSRFSNFISAFRIDEHGHLEHIQYIDSVGQIPRDFCLDQSEKYVIVPHQDSDFVSIFERNQDSGLLTFLNNDVEIPESVCVIAL